MPSIYEGLGTEEVMDLCYIVLRETFNDALAYQQTRGDALDAARAAATGGPVPIVNLEPVPVDNFHVGSIPSFVQTEDRTVDYPMLVVAPGRTVPDPEDARMDHYNVYQNAVSIHCFARANPQEGVEIAYRRSERMAEAVHQIVHTDSRLRRKVAGISGPVMIDRSEPWYFPVEDGHGEDWCWRAVMHMYQIKNYSITPQEV